MKGCRQVKAEGSGPAQHRRAGKGLKSNNSVQGGPRYVRADAERVLEVRERHPDSVLTLCGCYCSVWSDR